MPDPVSLDARPVRVEVGLSAEVVGSDYTLHDGRTGKVHFLNRTAALIWDLADGTRDLRALIAELERQFDTAPPDLRTEVEHILRELEGEGLLELPRL